MKIFISYSNFQVEIAKQVKTVLENHFGDQIELFLASDDILASDDWRKRIQEGLKECDAILSIVTPNFLERPWVYIEWGAFWVAQKRIYLTYLDLVDINILIDPMLDSQVTNLSNSEDVFKLLKSIGSFLPVEPITTKDFATKTSLELQAQYTKFIEKQKSLKYTIYKDNIGLLPSDDLKKMEIFEYFMVQRDYEFCKEIFKRINQYSIETQILKQLLDAQEYELIEYIFEVADSRDALLEILKSFANLGLEGHPVAEKILNHLKESNTILRQYAEYFVRKQEVENNVFNDVVGRIENNAELKKLAQVMISTGLFNTKAFEKIVEKFYLPTGNRAELKNVLIPLIEQDEFSKDKIEEYIIRMSKLSQKETSKLLEEILSNHKELVRNLVIDKKIITNETLLEGILSKL